MRATRSLPGGVVPGEKDGDLRWVARRLRVEHALQPEERLFAKKRGRPEVLRSGGGSRIRTRVAHVPWV